MLENTTGVLNKALAELKKEVERLKMLNRGPKGSQGAPGANGISQDQLASLLDELARLRNDFEEHKDYAQRHISALDSQMPTKADK